MGDTAKQQGAHGDVDCGLRYVEASLVVTHDLSSTMLLEAWGQKPMAK